MNEEIDVKEHAKNLVCAIQALTPSRNLLIQFLAMSSLDFPTMYDTFPEILKDKEWRKALEMAFGVSFGEKVDLNHGNNLGRPIVELYEKVFNTLTDEKVREGLALLSGIPQEKIPNPRKEWIHLRLEGLALEPSVGEESLLVLKTIKRVAEERDSAYPQYKLSLSDVEALTNIDERRILSIVDLLLKYKLVGKSSIREDDEEGRSIWKDAIEFGTDLRDEVDLLTG